MNVNLFNIEEFIKINNLQEVTSPILFERGGIPNPKGLISNEIFGVSTKDRRETFAYISLNGYFFHPHVYKVFKRLYRNIEQIVGGTETYSINKDGVLVKDPNGETGLQFIYDNWEKIKWQRTQGMRNERIDILTKSDKNEVFMKYQIVIPAFYRDVTSDSNGGGTTRELNAMYVKLIRLVSLIRDESLFDFSFHSTIKNIQDTIVQIYDYFKSKLNRKNGLIRKFLLGKSVDYSVRSVIAAPLFHVERPEDNMIDLMHCAMPISQCCALFYPFIFAWVYNFFQREWVEMKHDKTLIITRNDTGEDRDIESSITVKDPESFFDDRYVKKMIDKYIKNPDGRFDILEFPGTDGKMHPIGFMGQMLNEDGTPQGIIRRPCTITDILFRACAEVTANKHVMVTRYPITDYFSMFFNSIRVASTNQTVPMDINGTVYKWYPKIDLTLKKSQVGAQFIDTTKFSNSYLAGLSGDYDGDQVTVKSLYTLEANEEAEEIMHRKSFVITTAGKNIRKTDNECIQGLYVLTKDPQMQLA